MPRAHSNVFTKGFWRFRRFWQFVLKGGDYFRGLASGGTEGSKGGFVAKKCKAVLMAMSPWGFVGFVGVFWRSRFFFEQSGRGCWKRWARKGAEGDSYCRIL